jgi:hypothetical protein
MRLQGPILFASQRRGRWHSGCTFSVVATVCDRSSACLRVVPPNVVQAVEELLRTATLTSRAAGAAIGTLTSGQHVTAMDAIVSEMRKNAEWAKTRSDVRGAVLLARGSSDAAKVLARYLRSLPTQPPWLGAMLRDENWFKE